MGRYGVVRYQCAGEVRERDYLVRVRVVGEIPV
jgi:hypothetical protein